MRPRSDLAPATIDIDLQHQAGLDRVHSASAITVTSSSVRDEMMTLEETRELRHSVERMDCGGCALKIENGLRRLPGAGDISVRLALASLSLAFDGDRHSTGEIEGGNWEGHDSEFTYLMS